MSRDGSIDIVWGDGEHRFRLGIGELRELQEKCDAGPAFILARLESGHWRIDDVWEPLRLGLIGGGMKPSEAHKLVSTYVDPPVRPLWESVPAARAVIMAALVGVPEEPVGKDEAAEETEELSSQETSSPSPPSTVTAPLSA